MTTTIICTDGSEIATRAATAGLVVLREADRLIIVTVVGTPDYAELVGDTGFAGGTMSETEFAESTQKAHEGGEETVHSLAATLGVHSAEEKVLTGDPGHALCSFAEEVSATTIVIGSHGRGGIKRAVLGSVSDHVVRHAPCPVLVVRA